MMQVEELERAVVALPKKEYTKFRQWFLNRDWSEWDREIEEDSKAGKLDFLIQEAAEAKRKGKLREL